jgi:hypothetical protein
MKHHPSSFLVLALLGCITGGCARLPSPTAADPGAPASKTLTRSIKLARRTLEFQPTRDDLTVGGVVFSVSQLANVPRDGVRINGTAPKNPQIYLKQVGKNRFELPALNIQFSNKAMGGPLYLALKVWFNEVSSQGDPFLYQNLPDRYALLTYCTDETEDPGKVNSRWGANRAATLQAFNARLATPLTIQLNQQPLRSGAGYPMVNDAVSPFSDADLRALKELAAGQGENHPFAITAVSLDHANVHASVNDATRFYGSRIYRAVKVGGAWRVEDVEYTPNGFW